MLFFSNSGDHLFFSGTACPAGRAGSGSVGHKEDQSRAGAFTDEARTLERAGFAGPAAADRHGSGGQAQYRAPGPVVQHDTRLTLHWDAARFGRNGSEQKKHGKNRSHRKLRVVSAKFIRANAVSGYLQPTRCQSLVEGPARASDPEQIKNAC